MASFDNFDQLFGTGETDSSELLSEQEAPTGAPANTLSQGTANPNVVSLFDGFPLDGYGESGMNGSEFFK